MPVTWLTDITKPRRYLSARPWYDFFSSNARTACLSINIIIARHTHTHTHIHTARNLFLGLRNLCAGRLSLSLSLSLLWDNGLLLSINFVACITLQKLNCQERFRTCSTCSCLFIMAAWFLNIRIINSRRVMNIPLFNKLMSM